MKRMLIIVLTLIIIGALGYGVFYIITSDLKLVVAASEQPAGNSVLISDNRETSEWREEDRTRVSCETGLLKSWPDEGPKLIWSNLDLPEGHSSPTFGNNSIYLTGNDGQNDILVSLDATGKIKWQTPYGRAWTASNPESRCTPTVEGSRVYVSSGSGDLACIDGVTGTIVWSMKASETFRGTYGEWGIAESLLVDDKKVYFNPGGPETMSIALDKNTGDIIWKSESINDGPSYVSPVLIMFSGKRMLINVSLHYIYAVDVSDGSVLWKVNHMEALDSRKSVEVWPDAPLIKCVTPLYHNGKIYVTGGYDHGSILLSLKEDGSGVSVDWTDEVLDVHHGGVVLVDGYIYGSNWLNNGNGNWCCLEWNSGKKMYEEHWKCKGSIISADGMLYIYDEKTGFAGLVRPDPQKFDLVSSFKVRSGSGPYWAHPVIHNGVLYLRHGEALLAYDIKEK